MPPRTTSRRGRTAEIDAVLRARRRLRGDRPAPTGSRAQGARLRVADVALFYGERSGGIRTYLDNKIAWARETPGVEHHLIVPGPTQVHEGGRHELPSFRVAAANGYRLPLGVGALKRTLRELRPDVVLLHDPFWGPLGVCAVAHEFGARVVAVHHGSSALDAAGMPGPDAPWRAGFRAWMHHAYRDVDAIMSAVDTVHDSGRAATIPLRFGLHPAFAPSADPVERGDHVLYVGRIAREKGVFDLVRAAARSPEPWPLRLVGTGPALDRVKALAAELGLGRRLQLRPYIRDPAHLAETFRRASAVVMPGAHETFGLVGFEAAASGACAVACETAPSARVTGSIVRTFPAGDVDGLLAAVAEARAATPDLEASARLARTMTWERAFGAELADLRELVR